jgi:Spy/CpxP family protein refolding chaperone
MTVKTLSLALLTAGALLAPVAGMAAKTAPAAAPAATTSSVNESDAKDEIGALRKKLDALNLTAAQKDQINKDLADSKDTFAKMKQDRISNKKALEAVSYGNYDASKVQSLADEQGKLASQAIVERAKLQSEIYKVLTPEQQKQLDTELQTRRAAKKK